MAFDDAAVAAWLKITRDEDTSVVPRIVTAVSSFINRCPTAPTVPADPPDAGTVWAPETEYAALLLAARLFRRRNSPAGIEAFTDQGASYVARIDPDVSRLLRIDSYAPPRIG